MKVGLILSILFVAGAYQNAFFKALNNAFTRVDGSKLRSAITWKFSDIDVYTYQPVYPIITNLSMQANNISISQKFSGNIDNYTLTHQHYFSKDTPDKKNSQIKEARPVGSLIARGRVDIKNQTNYPESANRDLIISDNWKKDILTFCRARKEQIEINPDPQLICSTIAISHFDYVMELVSRENELSDKILTALNNAIQSRKDFEAGKCPDFVAGLNKIRLKRYAGSAIEEFAVLVPNNYTNSRAWPVLLHTGNTGWAKRDKYPSDYSLIDIWWHTVSHKEIKWKDYRIFMEVIEQKLNIDKDRIYLDGDCMNGISAIALALNYPDQWAECSATLGNSYRHLASNAMNLPVIFVKGQHNEDLYEGYYDFAVKCFQYSGCRHFKWSQTQETAEVRGGPVPAAIRENNPHRVSYTIGSLGNPKAYWVKISGRDDENQPGTIDTRVEGQTIHVNTKNIDAYILNLSDAPLDTNRPVEIIENGQSLGQVTDRTFQKKAEKYNNTTYIKDELLHGPVREVFTDSFVIVQPTGNRFSEAGKKAATLLAGGGPIYDDSNIPEQLIESHNIVVIGTVQSNQLLSKISDRLPVRIDGGQIIANGKIYNQSDIGFILIYPNPLNPEKYVAVFSGTTQKTIANIHAAYTQMKEIRPADVGIFEVTDTGDIKWLILEKFNTVWDWHSGWDRVLITTERKHPKWQWRQWVATVIKKQLDVDVVICEDPFLFENSQLAGQITYRDLFNTFRNDWIIKIELSGRELKKLLTVPFADISKRKIDTLIIEGISLIKSNQDTTQKILSINELEDNKKYTVALPEKCLNGQRMGVTLSDYQMLDEVYLIPALTEYLTNNSTTDIDSELESMNMNVF